jgi:CubicO group peptidase (beta-lactamase class C family)
VSGQSHDSSPVPDGSQSVLALVDSTCEQDRRFAAAFRLLQEAVAHRVFPGAALVVARKGELLAWKAFGNSTYATDAADETQSSSTKSQAEPAREPKRITRETVWDLASLTKPIATTSMAMLLWQQRRLSLDAQVVALVPEFADAKGDEPGLRESKPRESVTVRMLLAHSSGLPAHRKLYQHASGREAMVAAALRVPLAAAPMERAEYSDVGFIVLGELLERVAGERIDSFCQREIFYPLKLTLNFCPETAGFIDIPPTVIDIDFRKRTVRCEVNDENAFAMGGVAGHAGLFGDALSVAGFAQCLLSGGQPLFQRETVELFTTRESLPRRTTRTLGWDTPSAPSQSGTRFSPKSFGHLGYTGTSLWCDPDRGLSVTLLTNRTWPDGRNQAIKQVRPAVHDAIVGALDEG